METIYRRFTDKPDIVKTVIRRGNKTEITEWESKFQRNLDIPDNLSYWEMGIEELKNPHLDASEEGDNIGCMDDRHFREHCVIYGQSLFFIHQKLKADMQPPLQLRPEWIQDKLECEFLDACTLSEAWKQLEYSKWIINKMIFGYFDSAKNEWKDGLRNIGPAKGAEFAEYFENLASEFNDTISEADCINGIRGHYYDISQRMIDSGEWYAQYHVSRPDAMDQMAWIEYMSDIEYDETVEIIDIVEDDFDYIDGYINYFGNEEIITKTSDPFGINRLYHGDEGISQELITEIKEASAVKLKKIQRRFYRDKYFNRRAKYWWMTPMQKSVAWEFIKARKVKLSNYRLSKESREVLNIEIESYKIKRALIASYCAGNSFNLYGELIKWKKRPNENEIIAIWSQFNKGT